MTNTHERSKVDLHVHTHFSGSAGDWLMAQIGVKESYTTPEQVYRLAKARGMDYVTITDHDSIDGALEIAHYDDAFVSEEITTYFPEDGAKMHVVALGITEAHHQEIQQVRGSIYELALYLHREGVIHFVAHPFFCMAAPLTLEHFEKCLLLFPAFEVRNGGKEERPRGLMESVLRGLTPERMDALAEKHRLTPLGERCWEKTQVAGSDDHGGILIGAAHTATPRAAHVQALLGFIRDGETRPQGHAGSPLAVAHSILTVSYHSIRHRRSTRGRRAMGEQVAWNILGQLFETVNMERSLSFSSRILLYLNHYAGLPASIARRRHPLLGNLAEQVKTDPTLAHFLRCGLRFNAMNHEKLFAVVTHLLDQTLVEIAADFLKAGRLSDLGPLLKRIQPLLFLVLPYLIGFKTENRDRPLMRRVAACFLPDRPQGESVLVFADGEAAQVRGEASLNRFLAFERRMAVEMAVFGVGDLPAAGGDMNFKPLLTHKAGDAHFALPSLLTLLDAVSQRDVTKIYIHTHGPMALMGLAAGRWLGLPVHGRYPYETMKQWSDRGVLTGAERMKRQMAEIFIRQLDKVHVDSDAALAHARDMGVPWHRCLHVSPQSSPRGEMRPEDLLAGQAVCREEAAAMGSAS